VENVAESSKEGCGSKSAIFPIMMMMMMMMMIFHILMPDLKSPLLV
jgi:hypothetical protein